MKLQEMEDYQYIPMDIVMYVVQDGIMLSFLIFFMMNFFDAVIIKLYQVSKLYFPKNMYKLFYPSRISRMIDKKLIRNSMFDFEDIKFDSEIYRSYEDVEHIEITKQYVGKLKLEREVESWD